MHVGIGVFGKQLAMSLETVVDLYLHWAKGQDRYQPSLSSMATS